jgi:hypothetical protein
MGPQSELPPQSEIRVRLASVIHYLYAVAGPDDPMLQALVKRYEQMGPDASRLGPPSAQEGLCRLQSTVWAGRRAAEDRCTTWLETQG